MSSYADFRPMWEVWKRNTRRPSDECEARTWDAVHEIFRAVRASPGEVSSPAALEFVRQSLPESLNRLRQLPEWNPGTERFRLYRGLRNEFAAEARVYGRASIAAGRPVSLTFDRGSAVGFAGQGFNSGYVCAVEVPLNVIVFADLDDYYREGNMHHESEVVVVTPTEIRVSCEIEHVAARSRWSRSNAEKAANERERSRLEEFEASLRAKIGDTGNAQIVLRERETDTAELAPQGITNSAS